MNQKNRILEQYGLWLLDIICIVAVFVTSTYIRFGNFRDMGDKNSHFLVCFCFVLFCTAYGFFLDWNRDFTIRGYYREMVTVLKFNVMMVLVVQVVMYFFKWSEAFSRTVMIYFFVGNTVLMYVLHVVLKKVLWVYYQLDMTAIKVMVVGQKDRLPGLVERLKKNLDMHYQIIAIACYDKETDETTIQGIPVVAGRDNLLETARQMALDEVFISLPDATVDEINRLIMDFDEMGIICHRKLEADVYGRNSSRIETYGSYTVITYMRFNSSYKKLLLKRAMDIVGGIVGLLITAILTPFIALAIKIDSPGPIFFSQTRIGRNGRRFKIYKFRSMYLDAEERKKELQEQNEIKGLMFKMKDDPRITRVGRFIRKTSLDELPQFYNVLKGDMSLVGTRPPTVDEFEKYSSYYRRRLSMTPGLTGMWQVSGRSSIEDFDEVVKLDLLYIDGWSLGLDIKILLQTILVVFTGRGSK